MRHVYLLRHAQAAWAAPGERDFDRALAPQGLVDARQMGMAMQAAGVAPSLTICSTARRARETAEAVLATLPGRQDVRHSAELYETDASSYVAAATSAAGNVLIVGHNPMIEEAAVRLAGDGEEAAVKALRRGFPTTGLAVIRFDGAVAAGKGYLEAFLSPADF